MPTNAIRHALSHWPIDDREATALARSLAAKPNRRGRRSGRRPSIEERIAHARAGLEASGLEPEDAEDGALLLLALGLRARGLRHQEVAERLRSLGDSSVAHLAALRSADLVRRHCPALEPEAQARTRRLHLVAVFGAWMLWGAAGAHLFL